MDSALYSSFPWAYSAYLVLVLWALFDLILRKISSPSFGFDDTVFGQFIGGLVFVLALGCIAGLVGLAVVIILTAPVLLYRLVRAIIQPRVAYPIVSRIISISFAIMLMTIAAFGIARRASMSEMDAFDRLVFAGTAGSKEYAESLARDPHLDLERLRQMIASGDTRRAEKAFEVLTNRANPQDLVFLASAVRHHLPTTAPPNSTNWTSDNFRLRMWFESMDLKHIATRQDLRDWLVQQSPEADTPHHPTDDIRQVSPQQVPP
jgi:hypothetical protein